MLDLRPEAGGVVHLLPVAQLVDDHIVQHLRRREHQQAVKVEISLTAAASPQGMLTADGDSAVGHAHQRGKIGSPFRYCLPRLTGKRLQLPVRKGGKKPPEIPFRTFERDGFTVYAGRSNIQNDRLVRMSAPNDLWLHARNLHSAHVVIRTQGKKVPKDVLDFAAGVCAKFSAAGGSKIPVDCCPVKNVRKPKGSKAGFVTYSDFETLLGDPDLAQNC